ncbi:agmatine deiminase family protein [Frankia sp. AiPs1]|uniref:agmatine deiminase family protein n=1 Tax=Frankia sp. AiPs1 TaxID=573493 RepID=UPI0020438684|nr:agmatine deiminase family protein [Frankia sp. AiPs1]MCM3921850.1 agmatine deiminase family protein [Frankia sp. AiPs1]
MMTPVPDAAASRRMPAARRMPAEWERHARTWMAFPPPNDTFGPEGSAELATARAAWARVATTISRHELVTLIAGPGQGAIAARQVPPAVTVIELALDDAWMRDSGPTFTIDGSGSGSGSADGDGSGDSSGDSDARLGAVDWVFNGWGAQDWASWDADRLLATAVAARAGAAVRHSALTNEGGGIAVDGAGTVLLTETVQLDPARNPGWDRTRVEAELHTQLGTTRAIWLPRGVARDYDRFGTRGHVDVVAAFVRPGLVAVHSQPDPAHPDHETTRELAALLRASRDAAGRPLEVVQIAAPTVLEVDGGPAGYSYLNYYVANGLVVAGVFDDPRDADALDLLARLYPTRRVEPVDARPIFAHGGGVHCITQQEPQVIR